MSHKDNLYAWLKDNRPEVFAKIDREDMPDWRALPILNEASGLAGTAGEVKMLDVVEDGCRRFLEAFKTYAPTPRHGPSLVARPPASSHNG